MDTLSSQYLRQPYQNMVSSHTNLEVQLLPFLAVSEQGVSCDWVEISHVIWHMNSHPVLPHKVLFAKCSIWGVQLPALLTLKLYIRIIGIARQVNWYKFCHNSTYNSRVTSRFWCANLTRTYYRWMQGIVERAWVIPNSWEFIACQSTWAVEHTHVH